MIASIAGVVGKKVVASVRGPYKQWDHHCMECALAELEAAANVKNSDKEFNLNATAKKWGVPRKTLERYFQSPGMISDSRAGAKPLLTPHEEKEIIDTILRQHATGMSLNHQQVKWLVMEIVKRVPSKRDHPTGKAWLRNGQPSYRWYRYFLNRHNDKIRERVVDNLDPKRWFVSVEDVKSLYEIMGSLVKKYPEIDGSDICNLDETNITPEGRKSKVLAAKGARRTHTLINTHRFGMTMLPCVFADGTAMPPHFITKGKRTPQWPISKEFRSKIAYTGLAFSTFAVQENAWMDSLIFLSWFEEYFVPWVYNKRSHKPTATRPVILILDNFSGHVHPTVLRVAQKYHIIMLGLPPHSTHWTQPLDVTLMKPLKTYWTSFLNSQRNASWLDNIHIKEQHIIEALAEACEMLGRNEHGVFWSVWDKCFRPSNIKSAFYDTGLWPVDWDKVKDQICEAARRAQEEKLLGKRSREDEASSSTDPCQPAGCVDCPELPKAADELRLEAEYLETVRKAEQLAIRLAQIESFKKRKAVSELRAEETWEPTVETDVPPGIADR